MRGRKAQSKEGRDASLEGTEGQRKDAAAGGAEGSGDPGRQEAGMRSVDADGALCCGALQGAAQLQAHGSLAPWRRGRELWH